MVGSYGVNASGAGESYRLDSVTGDWELTATYFSPNQQAGNLFGISLSLDQSERFVFGAQDDLGDGRVYTNAGFVIGTQVCAGMVNSTGLPARQAIVGNGDVTVNNITLYADQMPGSAFCLPLAGQGTQQLPLGQGLFCIGGEFARTQAMQATPAGTLEASLDLTMIGSNGAGGGPIMAGQTWRFQTWYRDGASSNLTGAIAVTFN